ncbi:hypothetical protein F9817_22950 [Vibrio sp. CAIM 722]|uniref:O-antigen ligase-related domain-containing protein n=1 Tax=Vibrio eleionomae TaxID=2653505 RepID=A0A7X4LPZ8_9VIBR|nr:O-antigen ligase family protein [Vibrio eleionomae]MZI96048.1 hypothetical protein [Vibrio eleionomae]
MEYTTTMNNAVTTSSPNKFVQFYDGPKMGMFMLALLLLTTLITVGFEDAGRVLNTVFMVLSIPLLWLKRHRLYKDPMVKLLGAVLIIQVMSWLNGLHYHPDFVKDSPSLDRLSKLFSFIFVAYWLKGSPKAVKWLMVIFTLGVAIGALVAPDFQQQLARAMVGQRADFSIKNAQFTAMFAGVGMLICALCLYWSIKSQHLKVLKSVLSILGFSILTWLFIVSQARQAWLGMAAALAILPIALAVVNPHYRGKKLLGFYLIIAIMGGLFSTSSIVEKRLNKENSVMETILRGDWQHIPMTSVGIRFNSWIDASKWISAHPILGNSDEAIKQVIKQSDKFSEELKERFGHLHNFHIETLVAYGIVGLIAIYSLYYWWVRSIFLAMKEKPELKSFTVFALIYLTFWLVINCFETFSSRTYGVYTHTIIFGCIYTFYLTSSLERSEQTEL